MYDSQIQPPSHLELLLETRTVLELGRYFVTPQPSQGLPRGDGHPVLVIPGFLVGDTSTYVLRQFLDSLGYATHPWDLGLNVGFYESRLEVLSKKIKAMAEASNQAVSIIGWSLGGLYTRELARHQPELVRQVITLGTPFARSLNASRIRPFYEWVSGNRTQEVDPELFERIQSPPPVPTTAIYTQSDGIVAWETTMEQEESDTVQNICVEGSHCGLGHNLEVLAIIADRLSQPKGQWRRYQATHTDKPAPSKPLRAATQQLDTGLAKLEALIERKLENAHGLPADR